MTEIEPSAPLPERRPLTEAEIVARYQATLDPAALRRDRVTRMLGDHRLIAGRCRCGFDPRMDYFRHEQHCADAVLALFAPAEPRCLHVAEPGSRHEDEDCPCVEGGA